MANAQLCQLLLFRVDRWQVFYVQIQVSKFIPHSLLLHDYFFKALVKLGNIILQNIAYSNMTKFENNFSSPLQVKMFLID